MTDGAIPLRWGEGGPVIGSAIINDDGTVSGIITSEVHTEKLTPLLDSYSIVDLNDKEIDFDQMKYFTETPPGVFSGPGKIITIKKEETDD